MDSYVLYADGRIDLRFKVPVSEAKVGESLLSAARLSTSDFDMVADDDDVLNPVVARFKD